MALTSSDRKKLTLLAAMTSAAVLAAIMFAQGPKGSLMFIPAAVIVPIAVHIALRENRPKNQRSLLNESPATIGTMSLVIASGGTLDTAVREIAEHGTERMSDAFRKVARRADLRLSKDIETSLLEYAEGLNDEMRSFKRSIRLIASASVSRDGDEKRRTLKDAENASLEGLREMGNEYGASLNNPCMMIFGIGIMVPMILMSILPMASVGGWFAVSFLNIEIISFITLIAVPAVIAVTILSISSSNPFIETSGPYNKMRLLPLAAAVPIFALSYILSDNLEISLISSMTAAGIAVFVSLRPVICEDKKRSRTAGGICDSLFSLGGQLDSGESFETAVIRSLAERKETEIQASAMKGSMMISRGDTPGAIGDVLSQYSDEAADMYAKVYSASEKNVRDAGKLAVSLGYQMQDRVSVKKEIDNKLKGMKDMMMWTAALFAPIVMGLSIVLLKPLSSVTGSSPDGIAAILCVYLLELTFLISVLTTYLGNRKSAAHVFCMFGTIMPVAMIIFAAVSGISI